MTKSVRNILEHISNEGRYEEVYPEKPRQCPECASAALVEFETSWECMECGRQFGEGDL